MATAGRSIRLPRPPSRCADGGVRGAAGREGRRVGATATGKRVLWRIARRGRGGRPLYEDLRVSKRDAGQACQCVSKHSAAWARLRGSYVPYFFALRLRYGTLPMNSTRHLEEPATNSGNGNSSSNDARHSPSMRPCVAVHSALARDSASSGGASKDVSSVTPDSLPSS